MRFRGLVFSALFAALFAVLSLVSIPIGPIPITIENLVIMLTGALLGPWYGALTFLIVIGLDLLGLPLIRGNAGIGLLVGATAGYIWSWPILAWLTGYFVGKIRPRTRSEYWLLLIVLFICGDLISYVPGVLWLRHVVPAVRPWGKAMMAGAIPFLPGDFAKALVASAIVLIVRRVYPQERIIRGQQFVSQSLEQGAGRGD